nr:diguanylate cyclase [uncultured Shimia sp.]
MTQVFDFLDVLCPMHAVLDRDGVVCHSGPTLQKVYDKTDLIGTKFLDLFEVLRPRTINDMGSLLGTAGAKLHLRKSNMLQTALKGVLVPLPDTGGAIVNLSFGISIMEGVRDYALTEADFAATDLTIEMLYLIEAKSAAMEASRKLNLRLQGAMIAAEEQAFTDTLTGLKNRRAVDHILPRLIEHGAKFSCFQMDLDFFKAVNDTHGHPAGDHVLQHVARVLVEETRSDDCVARVGGDEFVLLFSGPKSRIQMSSIARRIIDRIETPVIFKGAECRISASIGIAVSDDVDPLCADAVLAAADSALYQCKNAGRATYAFYAPDHRCDEIA